MSLSGGGPSVAPPEQASRVGAADDDFNCGELVAGRRSTEVGVQGMERLLSRDADWDEVLHVRAS
ncbi:MAG: hypothetical protein V9E94_19485 [Microthrixaceae bacterium]